MLCEVVESICVRSGFIPYLSDFCKGSGPRRREVAWEVRRGSGGRGSDPDWIGVDFGTRQNRVSLFANHRCPTQFQTQPSFLSRNRPSLKALRAATVIQVEPSKAYRSHRTRLMSLAQRRTPTERLASGERSAALWSRFESLSGKIGAALRAADARKRAASYQRGLNAALIAARNGGHQEAFAVLRREGASASPWRRAAREKTRPPDCCRQRGSLRRASYAVPPTVIRSMRKVGWPTPTGTLWPSFPHTPTPESSAMSLPIMLTYFSDSGPLPIKVAPLTG